MPVSLCSLTHTEHNGVLWPFPQRTTLPLLHQSFFPYGLAVPGTSTAALFWRGETSSCVKPKSFVQFSVPVKANHLFSPKI